MINKIFDFFKKTKDDITIELAATKDISLIFNLIVNGAKHGSFNSEYFENYTHRGLTYQIETTIMNHEMPISENKSLKSTIYVLKHNLETVGFSWIRYHDKDKCERYMGSIVPEKRNQGYYTTLVLGTQKLISSKYIYADVYHNSNTTYLT